MSTLKQPSLVLLTVLMVWLLLMWKKQSALHLRLDGLERAIDRAAAKMDEKDA